MHRHTALAIFLIALCGLFPLVSPTDVDLWWHLRSGQWIAEHGVPHSDVFSHSVFGQPWVDHEWLIQLWMHALYLAFGYPALLVLFGLVMAATAALVHRGMRERGAGRALALAALVPLMLLMTPTAGVRPQVLGTLFAAAFALLLERHARGETAATLPWQLGLLMLLWVNLHGSFVLGIGLIALHLLAELATRFLYRPATPRPLRPLLLALLVCLTASLLNPYGPTLWRLPFDYLLIGQGHLMAMIGEWQPQPLQSAAGFALTLTLLPLLVFGLPSARATGLRPRWAGRPLPDLTAALLVCVFVPMTLQAAYYLPLFGTVVLPIAAASLAQRWPSLSRTADTPVPAGDGRLNRRLLLAGTAVTLAGALALPQAQTASTPRFDGRVQYPQAAVAFVETLPAGRHLLNDFDWGGYLIERLYPRQRVFIDGRVDPYRAAVFTDYLRITTLEPDWRERLDRYAIDTTLIRSGSPLDGALAHEAGWRLAYRDPLAVVYRRH